MKPSYVQTSERPKGEKAVRLRVARRCGHADISTFGRFDDLRRGFTMLEVIIVVAILAILATLAIPRLLDHQDRVFNLTCDRVADLLVMYAQRERLGQIPVGLSFDPNRRWLSVMVYEVDPESGHDDAQWRFDPMIQPVKLPPSETAELIEVRGDGRVWDTSIWPLASKPGQDRPSIEIVLQGPSRAVSIVLPSYAVAPRMFDADDPAIEQFTPIDLTKTGRSRQDW